MIIQTNITTDLTIYSLNDLTKLKPFLEDSTLKINKSQIARELNVDRRTVDKYLHGFEKSHTRKKKSVIDDFHSIIEELLSDSNSQVFYYRRVLWQYLVDNHSLDCCYSNFCHYLKAHPEFDTYFNRKRASNTNRPIVRFETGMAKQAQLDWKESIPFLLSTGESIEINIFVLLLSYSRFQVYRLSVSKAQEVLLSFMNDAFEVFGGVPDEIVTDNMKTVMDKARTEHSNGKVNVRFQQFADDYGFRIRPCMAARPQTKAKVEAPMKILDEIRAYSGKLNYEELNQLVSRINDRVNSQVNQGTGRIPLLYFQKEKAFLNPLPAEELRKPYYITTHQVTVNPSCMFHYKGCQYSVPPEYRGCRLSIQVYDNYIHVYYNTKLITMHTPGTQKLNYHPDHYRAIVAQAEVFREEEIEHTAKENLKAIGDMYRYE